MTFFDMMKNELARALLAFSRGPHSKLENMRKMLQFLSIRARMDVHYTVAREKGQVYLVVLGRNSCIQIANCTHS